MWSSSIFFMFEALGLHYILGLGLCVLGRPLVPLLLLTTLQLFEKVKHELRLRLKSSNLRVTSSNLRVTSSNLQVISSNPHVASSNLRVTSSNPQVRRLKSRVARLKERVEAIKPNIQSIKFQELQEILTSFTLC